MDDVKPFQRFRFRVQFDKNRVVHNGFAERCNVSEDSAWLQVSRDLRFAGYRMIQKIKTEVVETFPLHHPVPGGRAWEPPKELYGDDVVTD